MGKVVAFKKGANPPRLTLYESSILARTLFWLVIYVTGMLGMSFGAGYALPHLIHECAPVKPFMEKWMPAP